jgi:hypothetical protein
MSAMAAPAYLRGGGGSGMDAGSSFDLVAALGGCADFEQPGAGYSQPPRRGGTPDSYASGSRDCGGGGADQYWGAGGTAAAQLQGSGGAKPPRGASGAPPALNEAVEQISVTCGDLEGTLLLPKRRVVLNAGTADALEVSPTEFERLGGKGRVKKWRMSVMKGEWAGLGGGFCGARGLPWAGFGSG